MMTNEDMNVQKANEKSFLGGKKYDFQKLISVTFYKSLWRI